MPAQSLVMCFLFKFLSRGHKTSTILLSGFFYSLFKARSTNKQKNVSILFTVSTNSPSEWVYLHRDWSSISGKKRKRQKAYFNCSNLSFRSLTWLTLAMHSTKIVCLPVLGSLPRPFTLSLPFKVKLLTVSRFWYVAQHNVCVYIAAAASPNLYSI